MKSWRQHRRKTVIGQILFRGKCARRRCEEIREAEGTSDASSDVVGQEDHEHGQHAGLPAPWRTPRNRSRRY
jgi:hypothetical protein